MNRIVAGYQVGSYSSVKKQQAYTKLDSIKAKTVIKLLIIVSFLVMLSLFYIWSRVQVVQSGYLINELKRQQGVLKNNNKLLKMELSLLKSPSRLEKVAIENLKMQVPEQKRIIKVD